MRSKLLLLLLPLLPGPLLPAAGFLIHDLKVPIYDAAGQLTRTLTAASAEGAIDRPVLKTGVIEFHTAVGEKVAPGSKLSFAEAVYDKAGGFVEGSGPIRFTSSKADLSGVGFHYELETGRLKLRSDVLLEPKDAKYKGVKIRGESADSLVLQNPTDRSWTLGDTVINGPVATTAVTIAEVRYDRLETDRVTYSAADGIIKVAAPVTGWLGGKKSPLAGAGEYRLDPAPPAAPVPSPTAEVKAP